MAGLRRRHRPNRPERAQLAQLGAAARPDRVARVSLGTQAGLPAARAVAGLTRQQVAYLAGRDPAAWTTENARRAALVARGAAGRLRRDGLTEAELQVLAGLPWGKLAPSVQKALRVWRGRRGAESRRLSQVERLVLRADSDDLRDRARARAEIKALGTRRVAEYLQTLDYDGDEVASAIAYWFYSPVVYAGA